MDKYIGNSGVNLVKHLADKQGELRQWSCEGTITSVDKTTYMAKVMLQPLGIESGWLPIGTIAAGRGWGFFHLPPDGTLVTVDFLDGDVNNGRIRCVYANALDIPSQGIKQGEILMQHESGSFVHFAANGNVNIVAAGDLNAIVQGDTQISSLGDMTVSIQGDATVVAQGDLNAVVQGDIAVAGTGDMAVCAAGSINIAAPSINLAGAVTFDIPVGEALTMNVGGDLVANVTGTMDIATGGSATIVAPALAITAPTSIGPATTIDGHGFDGHTHQGVTPGVGNTGYVTP